MQSSRTEAASVNGHTDNDLRGSQYEVDVDARIQAIGIGDWGAHVADTFGSREVLLGADQGVRAGSDLFIVFAAFENNGGEKLVEALDHLRAMAPDAGRLAVTRLAARHAGPEQRARGLMTLNEILRVPSTSVLMIEAGETVGVRATRQADQVLQRLFALFDRARLGEDAIVGLSTDALIRLSTMRGFIGWREFELEHEMIATGGEWHDRLEAESTAWQPSGFDWSKAQGVLPFAFAPHDWLEEDARERFDRLVERAWDEAAPCEMAPAVYAGDAPGVGVVSFGLPFPTGLLEIRDSVHADRQRIAEKEREAATPIPLTDDFTMVEERPDGFDAPDPTPQPELTWEPPSEPAPEPEPAPAMKSEPEPAPESESEPESATEPTLEVESEPEFASEPEVTAEPNDARPTMEREPEPESTPEPDTAPEEERERMPWELPDDERSLEVGESTETPDEPTFESEPEFERSAADAPVAVAESDEDSSDAYYSALVLVRGLEGTEEIEKSVDLAKIRYALYDLLEVLRTDPAPLLTEVFRTDVEGDYFARHHVNVSILSMLTADEAESTLTDVIDVGTAAMIHDIGMSENRDAWDNETRLPPNVFDKAIREHPERGFERLQAIPGMTGAIARMVLEEHERMDGTGYPEGMSGEEIDPGARVIAACDTLEALTHPRPFREHLALGEALSRLQILGQYTLDATVVQTLTDVIGRWMPQMDSETKAD